MGWWSSDILGGDTPLDFQDSFHDLVGIDEGYDNEDDKTSVADRKMLYEKEDKSFVNKAIDGILNRWGCGDPEDAYYKEQLSIGYQVLAVEMMACGAKISDELKVLMEFHIPNDEWSHDDQERAGKINQLYEALLSYTGEAPVVISSKGLFETIAEKLSKKS